MYSYYVKSPARKDRKFKKLSLTTKLPSSYGELIAYQYQYAIDNQLGRNQVIIECRDENGIIVLKNNPYNFDENISFIH